MADKQDTSAFVGVSPEYRNYASDHFKPLFSEDADVEKAEKEAKKAEEDSVVAETGPTNVPVADADKAENKAEDKAKDKAEDEGDEDKAEKATTSRASRSTAGTDKK